MSRFNIKKGDEVKILAGKDKGRTGKVLEAFPKELKAVVEGVNIKVRFARPKRKGEKGQRMELPAAMSASKLMLVCPNCGRPTRVSHQQNNQGNFRQCKKCKKAI
jgi:large subunit ribosomal protein L24